MNLVAFFLHIYDFLSSRRWLCYSLLGGLTVLLLLMVSSLKYNEDIYDFLPMDANHQKAITIYQDITGGKRVVAMLRRSSQSPEGDAGLARLEEAVDTFAKKVRESDKAGHIKEVISQIDIEKIASVTDFVYQNIPLMLQDSDYVLMEKILSDQKRIEESLAADVQMMMMPATGYFATNIGNDPMGLFAPVMTRLQEKQSTSAFEIEDGYIFTPDKNYSIVLMTSNYGSMESANNSLLVSYVDSISRQTMQQMPDVEISITGSPVIAVDNATQIKKDSRWAILIAVVLILCLLVVSFRSVRNLMLIGVSILFGWLFAMAFIAVFRSNVSLIVLGIGSIIIGIAVNYPLHFIAHIGHGDRLPSRRESDKTMSNESVAADDRLPSRRESDKTMSNDAAAADGSIRDALKDMVSPLLIGNITTVGAFASLIPLDAPALRDLGLFAAFMLIGTILFVLVFLPHLVRKNRNEGKEFLLFGRLSSLSFKRHGWLAGVIAVLTIVFGYFSLNTSFDADMHHINYLTPTQERLMSDLKVSAGVKDSSSVYVVTEGATWEEALKKRSELSPLLDSLERGKQISSCTDVTDFICSEEQQSEKIRRWDRFWATHRTEALAQLRKYARKNGFSDEAFQGFEGIVTAKYSPHSFDYFEPLVSVLFGQSFSNSTGNCSVIDIVKPGQSSMSEVEDIINPQLSTYAFDFAGMNSAVANALSDDFNYIGFACGIIVFVFLWLSFGRIELSLLAFLPMALGWIWILGIMDILGMQFNIVNVILATFIFGQGDDYTIFMTDGLINEYAYRRKLLPSYKNSIIISALIMFIGMGSLIVAKHPALHSLAEVTIVGMLTVVLMAWVIPPMVFNWLTMNNNRLPSRRESDKTMSKESAAADGRLPSRRESDKTMSKESAAADGRLPSRRESDKTMSKESAAADGRLPSRRKSDKTMSNDAAVADGSVRRAPVTIEQIIRTIYCFIVYLFEILYGCLFGIIVKLIPFRREQCKLWFHKVICKTMKINIHNIWGVKTFIHNDSAEDFSKGSIIISNHQSILDPILMLALNPRVLILVSGKVWRNPVVHTLFKLAGFIKLTQPMENSPLEKEIAAAISKGYNVVLFPEGKRNEENITRFHKGAFYLAQKLDVDILPVYLHGVGHVMPKGSGFASRGQIDVFVGERIPAAKLSEYGNSHQLIAHHFYKSYQERLSEIRKEIETTHYFRNHVINMYIYKGIGIERETRKLLDKYDDFSKWIDGELKDETSSLSPLTFQFSPSDDRLPSWRESDKTMSKESVATDDRLSIFNAGKGQFSLMYALVHPEIEVHSYVNDADDAALLSACPLPPNLHIHYK